MNLLVSNMKDEFLAHKFYWIATGLFCLLFIGSAILIFFTPEESKDQFRSLGYPTYVALPVAALKLAGVIAILSRKSRYISILAFAGFLYDLLLAAGAHIVTGEPGLLLAITGLILWIAAIWVDVRRFGNVNYPQ